MYQPIGSFGKGLRTMVDKVLVELLRAFFVWICRLVSTSHCGALCRQTFELHVMHGDVIHFQPPFKTRHSISVHETICI